MSMQFIIFYESVADRMQFFDIYIYYSGETTTMNINKQKCRSLLIGIIAIYFFYFLNSLIQERMMKIPYTNVQTSQLEYFTSANSFNIFPSLFAWGIGFVYNNYLSEEPRPLDIPEKSWIKSAFFIVLSTISMMQAIYYTTYPLVTLFKSCNLVSVLCVGIFCSRVKDKTQKLQKHQLVVGLIVILGVLIYYFNSKEMSDNKDKSQNQGATAYLGIGLLFLSLICDGLIPDYQAEIKTKYKPTPLQMFQHINKWKAYLSLIYSVVTFQFYPVIYFLYTHPLSFLHLFASSLTGSAGQIFVYWLINRFRQHIVPFIITTRKIFTVVISIVFFNHPISFFQVLGIIIVFVAVIYQFISELKISIQKTTQNTSSSEPQRVGGQKSIQKMQATQEIQALCQIPDSNLQYKKSSEEGTKNPVPQSQEEIKI